jgi:UDPglucose--hexose-1-phosphate uridylyltransferase
MLNEIRRDGLGREVIISTKRSKRPGAFLDKKTYEKVCPFCPGNEDLTESTVLALPNEKKWKVRIFPNKFPVLSPSKFKQKTTGFYQTFSPAGIHEILVETPNHVKGYAELSSSGLTLVLKALKKRYEDLMRIPYVKYVTIFKNHGERAGASITHSHLQIIASPLFPKEIAGEMNEYEHYFQQEKACYNCLLVKKELEIKKRIVTVNRSWVCLAPYISTWPYQVSFFPKRHFSELSHMNDKELKDLAEIMHEVFVAFKKLFNDPPYNLMYFNFPKSGFWHFHIDVYPRLVTHAGFEFFGLNVNIVSPDEAAKQLKGRIKI